MKSSEAERGLRALAILEALAPKLNRLVHAHEMVAAALNEAQPGSPPVLSMITLQPATLDGAGLIGAIDGHATTDLADPASAPTVRLNSRFTAEGLRSIADMLDGEDPKRAGA